jgi:allantoin racemase
MRILVINPVATEVWDEEDRRILGAAASAGTEVEVVSLKGGPEAIETSDDEALAAPEVVALVREASGYSAMVINCFADPGLHACREASDALVLGAGETSMTVACLLGRRIGVLSVGSSGRADVELAMKNMGLSERLAYACGIDVPVLELQGSGEAAKLLLEEARTAQERGADVIVLGCTGMIGLAEGLRSELSCPVVEPATVTLKTAEVLAALELSHNG